MSTSVEAGPSKRGFHASSSEASNLPNSLPAFPLLPIVDIFDAPARLGGRYHFTTRNRYDLDYDAPIRCRISSKSKSTSSLRLPPPLLIDGPGRPTHPSLKRRTPNRTRPTAHRSHLSLLSATAPPPTTQPLVELFDGPARIVRSSPRSLKQATTRHLLLVGIAGTIFCASMMQISAAALDKTDSSP